MNIYSMQPDVNNFRWLMVTEPDQANALRLLWRDGTVIPNLPIRLQTVEDTETKPASDFPYVMSGVPVFSLPAKEVLDHILPFAGDLVPMVHREEEYYGARVPLLRGALDLERSDLIRFEGSIMRVRRYEFIPSLVRQHPVFTVAETSATVFVHEEVVTAVANAGLTGFLFDWVWKG